MCNLALCIQIDELNATLFNFKKVSQQKDVTPRMKNLWETTRLLDLNIAFGIFTF